MFFQDEPIRSRGLPFNVVISMRADGKTFNRKNKGIKKFLATEKVTIWVRREVSEIDDDFRMTFFDDIKFMYPDLEFKIKQTNSGGIGFINNKPAFFFLALSVALKHKSISHLKVYQLVFDEFIINPKTNMRYIKGEVFTFFELYHTIARPRSIGIDEDGNAIMKDPKIQVWFLANLVTINNPYFQYWQIKPSPSIEFNVYRDIGVVVQFPNSSQFREYMKTTTLGKSLANTDYGKYAVDGDSYLDREEFIEDKSKNSIYVMGFIYDNMRIGVWIDYQRNRVYINEQIDPSRQLVAVNSQEHGINTLYMRTLKKQPRWTNLVYAYDNGLMRFSNHMVESIMTEILNVA